MAPINVKKFRFSDAVSVIETTPKSFRRWLLNPELKLPFSEAGSGWREYTFADLAVLAIVRKLVDFGFDVGTASNFANLIVMSKALELFRSGDTPDWGMVLEFLGVKALFWRESVDSEWRCRLDDPLGKATPEREAEVTRALMGFAAKQPEEDFVEPANTYLVLNISRILGRVLRQVRLLPEEEEIKDPAVTESLIKEALAVEAQARQAGNIEVERRARELRTRAEAMHEALTAALSQYPVGFV
jgi:hypothetical protein